MANMVFGNPFGAALEGKRAALQDVLQTGREARQMRDTDLNYDFMKWYQPLRQAEAQSGTGGQILKQLNDIMHYTGDPTAVNTALLHYFGVPPEALPQNYASKHIGGDQQKAADLAFGGLPIPLSYPGVIAAGGAYQALPGSGQPQGSGDPELDALMQKYRRRAVQAQLDAFDNPPNANVPHLNPLGAPSLATQAGNSAVSVQDGSMSSPPPRNASPYGVAAPPKEPPSIFEDEYQPPGATNGSP